MKFMTLRAPRRPSCTTPLAKLRASITKPHANARPTFMIPRRRKLERLWRRLATSRRVRLAQSKPQSKQANKLTSKRSVRPSFPAAPKQRRLIRLRRPRKKDVLGALILVLCFVELTASFQSRESKYKAPRFKMNANEPL